MPGTSEHQLGIAVDINADKSKCSNEDVYGWLAENAYKYGFVLRYPPGKQKITGTSYEPWHIVMWEKRLLGKFMNVEYV